MLLPADVTLVLPVLTAGTCAGISLFSTSFRFIHFHIQEKALISNVPPCWRVIGDIAAASRPILSGHLRFPTGHHIRQEMSALFRTHHKVDTQPPPKWLQWASPYQGGHFLYMPENKAQFHPVQLPQPKRGREQLAVHNLGDVPDEQAILLLSEQDGQRFGLSKNQKATLMTEHGRISAKVQFGPVRQGCAWTHNAALLDDPSLKDAKGWRHAKLERPTENHEAN